MPRQEGGGGQRGKRERHKVRRKKYIAMLLLFFILMMKCNVCVRVCCETSGMLGNLGVVCLYIEAVECHSKCVFVLGMSYQRQAWACFTNRRDIETHTHHGYAMSICRW